MKKSKEMPLEEHLETANDLAIATHHLNKIFFRCQEHYYNSSNLMKHLRKICPGMVSGVFSNILDELDSEFHKAITEEEFKEYGHIYYNLEKRYKKIQEET